MFEIKTMNNIAQQGLDELAANGLILNVDSEDPDGLLIRSAKLHDAAFGSRLLAIARAGVGTDNVPVERCSEAGIAVFNTAGANAEAVKELAICSLLISSRNIMGGITWVNAIAGHKDVAAEVEKGKAAYVGPEIMGKTLGIIGLGAIGSKIANAAEDLGMNVWGYDPYLSVNAAWNLSRSVKHVLNVDDIYAECDYITIHVPLMDSTKGMINAVSIAKMKEGVILLNFARDLLANEKDVLEGLASGKIARYVSDFPNPTTAGQKGCIVIPHLGASTEESEDNCAVMAVAEMMDYLENGNIRNSVNYPACDMGVCTKAGRVAIFHRNIANMITQFTAEFGAKGINISELTNKSRGDVAYTMIDVESTPTGEIIEALEKIEGVFRVRIVK